MSPTCRPARLVVTGPTGVGKTAYVDAVARELPVEIVNMDSIQVYAFFRVGTGRSDGAAPTPRHLSGFLSPHESMSVGSYLARATAVAREIELRGRIPLFEGGSRSLLPAVTAAFPTKVYGLRSPADPAWIRERLLRRARSFLQDDALLTEVREALVMGYGDTRLMRDPMIYMQTRDYLDGRLDRQQLEMAMVESMEAMHHDQLRSFAQHDIEWLDVTREPPGALLERIERWLQPRHP